MTREVRALFKIYAINYRLFEETESERNIGVLIGLQKVFCVITGNEVRFDKEKHIQFDLKTVQ